LEEADATPAVSHEVGAEEDLSVEIASVIERELAFLRLAGHAIYDETNHIRRRRGVTQCVVFYCRGLPWAKRAKWLLPLLWSVAAVLKAQGCTCKVQAGELYAQPPSAGPGSNFIRLDFGAAHI
jgi:hypothetical protein